MTTGDEPMLPQPGDDNAPMISGRGTKVIADARGAYLARNTDSLIALMSDDQRQRFHNAVIQQVMLLVQRHMAEESFTTTFQPYLAEIESMIRNPTPRHPEHTSSIIFPAIMSRVILGLSFGGATGWAYDWRLDTAWAILQGREPNFWTGIE
jgi:hypothetical protein